MKILILHFEIWNFGSDATIEISDLQKHYLINLFDFRGQVILAFTLKYEILILEAKTELEYKMVQYSKFVTSRTHTSILLDVFVELYQLLLSTLKLWKFLWFFNVSFF